jgi:hypothetical protein
MIVKSAKSVVHIGAKKYKRPEMVRKEAGSCMSPPEAAV